MRRPTKLRITLLIPMLCLGLSACTDDKGVLDQRECEGMKIAASCHTWAMKLEAFDRRKAIEVYDRACRMGHTEGCVRIGDLYVKEDPRSANDWYKKACDQNNPRACTKQAETLLRLRGK